MLWGKWFFVSFEFYLTSAPDRAQSTSGLFQVKKRNENKNKNMEKKFILRNKIMFTWFK